MIYLDMDGVVCDMVRGAMRAAGVNHPVRAMAEWPAGQGHDYAHNFMGGIEGFWKSVDAGGSAFWAELEGYPWAGMLYESLSEIDRVVYLTSTPRRCVGCPSGKLEWLQARHGVDFREYVFTHHKALLARPGDVLVDDTEKQANAWWAAGGSVVVFPQPWNTAKPVPDCPDMRAPLEVWDEATAAMLVDEVCRRVRAAKQRNNAMM